MPNEVSSHFFLFLSFYHRLDSRTILIIKQRFDINQEFPQSDPRGRLSAIGTMSLAPRRCRIGLHFESYRHNIRVAWWRGS